MCKEGRQELEIGQNKSKNSKETKENVADWPFRKIQTDMALSVHLCEEEISD